MKKKLILFFLTSIVFFIPNSSFAKKETKKSHKYVLKKTNVDFADSDKKPNINISALPKENHKQIKKIVSDYSLYRRIDSVIFDTDSKTYSYLLNNLPFSASISRGLKFTKFETTNQKDGSIYFDDKKGMTAKVKTIYKDKNSIIFLGKGFYKGKIIGDVSGDMLLVINFKDIENKKLDSEILFFMKFESSFMNVAVKVVAFVFNSMLKRRVNHYLTVIKNISELIKNEPLLVYVSLKKNKIAKNKDIVKFKKTFLMKK